MRQISHWAHQHIMAARICIGVIYILLNITGLFVGDVLDSLQVIINPLYVVIPVSLTLFGLWFYPSKNNNPRYVNYYRRQKLADLILASATLFFIIYTGNVLNQPRSVATPPLYAISFINNPFTNDVKPAKQASEKNHLKKDNTKKVSRNKLKQIRKFYKESTQTEKIIYIILAVLVASLLVSGLSALACHLSCTGSEALAFIIWFGGLGGVIFGLVKVIQRITRGKPKKPKENKEDPEVSGQPSPLG